MFFFLYFVGKNCFPLNSITYIKTSAQVTFITRREEFLPLK